VSSTKQGCKRASIWRIVILVSLAGLFVLSAFYHYLIYLPQPDRPHRLTLLDDYFGLGIVGIVGLAGLAIGMRLLRPFRLAGFSRLERGALAVGVGWGLLSLVVLALGLADLLYLWTLLIALGASFFLCWREGRHFWTLLARPGLARTLRSALPRDFLTGALALVLLPALALLALQSLALPYVPYGSDLYQYHWAAPKLYLLHHAILVWPGWAAADLPFNSELLATLALAFGSEVAAVWLQAVFGILTVILLIGPLYRRFGTRTAWLGVALCWASPLFITLLISGYNEPAMAYYGVASVVVTLAWLEQSKQSISSEQWRLLVLSGVFAGFGLGVKYTEGQIIVGIAPLLIGAALVRLLVARQGSEPAWPVLRHHLVGLTAYSVACLVPLLPWLIRNWVLLANPIYPFIWGGPAWNEARTTTWALTMAHIGPQGPIWQRLAVAFLGLFFDPHRQSEPFYTPPNYLLLAALLVPIILALGWLRFGGKRLHVAQPAMLAALREVVPWLIVAGGAYVAWVLSEAQLERYAVVWLLLFVVPAAPVLEGLCHLHWHWPFGRTIAQSLRNGMPMLILLLVIVLGPLFSLPWLAPRNPLSLVTGQVSLRSWEEQHLMSPGYWAMVNYINTTIPRSAKLLVIGPGYFLDGRDYVDDSSQDWVPYLETEGRTPAGIVTLLRQQGFAYLVYNDALLQFIVQTNDNTYLASFLPTFRQFLATALRQVQAFDDFQLYRIPSS
jgi:hypothetical protein